MEKYFKPTSLTWWASVTPLVAGVVLALATAFGADPVVAFINSFFPGLSPAVLVNLGLVGIGVRGAIK